jgi:hypothetical protein
MMDIGRTDARDSVGVLLGASAATIVLWYIPFAGLVTYPIRLLVTYVHEICHASAALLTLGSPLSIAIFPDGSGLTVWTGGLRLVVQGAGYTITPLVGAALLLLSARKATVRPALIALGATLVGAAVVLGDGLLAWLAGLTLGPALVGAGALAPLRVARFCLSFLGVQCVLNALGDLQTMFFLSATSSGVATDAHLMAEATGGLVPPTLWALLWISLSLVTLALAAAGYVKLLLAARSRY